MANIFHASGWIDEGIIVARYAVEIAPELVINHFTLANIYSSRVSIASIFMLKATKKRNPVLRADRPSK